MENRKEQIAKNLRLVMSREGIKTKPLADMVGLSQSSISSYRNATRSPDIETIHLIANALGVEVGEIIGMDKVAETLPGYDENLVKIPILGTVRAGYNLLADENIIGYTYVSRTTVGNGEYYSLMVEGESMENMGIRPGDRILVKKQNFVEDGKVAVVLVDDEEATVKRVYRENGYVILSPESHHMKPEILDRDRVKILGKVVETTRSIE